ncbi:MAG TPA: M1 family aminopeptidase [Bryobacteraceae bacterium]|nr:M1 family aminopeptidase [Bryobacteraceae bacterium]
MLLGVLSLVGLAGQDTGATLAKAIREAGLDAQECYRVRDLSLSREDLKLYLTDGFLIFGKPVKGKPVAAVFTTEVEGGDAEMLLLPPHRSERMSLASFAHTPNLNEHLTAAVFLFTDDTAAELKQQLAASSAKRAPDMGLLLAAKWNSVVKNLTLSFEIRLVQDQYLNDEKNFGFFYGALTGKTVGNFDLIYDPRAREQITVGQIVHRENRTYFDIWTSFAARSWRNRRREVQPDHVKLTGVQIDAALNDDLHMTAITKLRFSYRGDLETAIPFEVSRRVKVTEVRLDGEPVEAFTRDSLRANLLRSTENDLFLVIPSKTLSSGVHELEFRHEGDVISPAGNGVYFVAARANWYPNHGSDFANYSLTFRYPKRLDLVATGDVVSDRTEGEVRITRRVTSSPVRFAGFNLGQYEKASQTRPGYTIQVVGNKKLEAALVPRAADTTPLPPGFPQIGRREPRRPAEAMPLPSIITPNPVSRLQQLASEVGSAVEFMVQHFGPLPVKTLTVSPIPGTFGQGFPGLLYLSTLTYLTPEERPASIRSGAIQTFFSDILFAHETAHQWWGNLVTASAYQDDWLMESLANYSALMFLEKRKGRKALDSILENYRSHLLSKSSDQTLESAGPIIWGTRLNSSQTPGAWRAITYEKGSWIMHMLRARMGDEAFSAMLREVVNRYRFRSLTTEQFHLIAQQFMPAKAPDARLDTFFEQWVYGTGIPKLKVNYTAKGKAPSITVSGSIVQTEVDEDFSLVAPIEVQLPGKRSLIHWVVTAGDPASFTLKLSQLPVKVGLDAGNILASH